MERKGYRRRNPKDRATESKRSRTSDRNVDRQNYFGPADETEGRVLEAVKPLREILLKLSLRLEALESRHEIER